MENEKMQDKTITIRNARPFVLTAAAALALGAAASAANAAVTTSIISDNFDGYATQGDFTVAWPAIGTSATNPSALLTTTQAQSAPNSVLVPGTAANNEYKNRRAFAETSTVGTLSPLNSITFSLDFYDSNPAGAPQRNYASLRDSTGTGPGQIISLGFNNSQNGGNSGGQYYMARVLGYTSTTVDPDGGANESVVGADAWFKLNDKGVGLRSLGWHNLKVVISTDDGLSADYAFYVDNLLAETVNNISTAANFRSYDNIELGSGLSNGSISAGFDNVSLSVTVPEPTTLAALAGLSVVTLRRRARA